VIVICIDDTQIDLTTLKIYNTVKYLIIGKKYHVKELETDLYQHLYWVKLEDHNIEVLVDKSQFITLEDYRHKQIQSII
jgi:hypothetical protein